MRRSLRLTIVGFLTAMVAGAGLLVTPAGAATPYCGITWGSLAQHRGQGPGFPPTPLLAVRAGEHPCYDRLVFEVDGSAAGYNVRYGPVLTQGRGLPMSLRGGAALDIVLYAPAYVFNGVNVNGFRTFRQVADGGSFEGETTVGLGVRARLPFRVFVLKGPGHHSRVVIDVAHHW